MQLDCEQAFGSKRGGAGIYQATVVPEAVALAEHRLGRLAGELGSQRSQVHCEVRKVRDDEIEASGHTLQEVTAQDADPPAEPVPADVRACGPDS